MGNVTKSICCATGKSGGHIIPNLTIAREKYPDAQILFFSNNSPLDYSLLKDGVAYHVPFRFLRTNTLLAKLLFPFGMIWASLRSIFYLIKYKPSVIISTGGIEAIPVCCAGWLLRIPIELYEVNALPGKAITLIAPLATTIFVCFKTTQTYFKNAQLTNYPIRFTTSQPIHIPHFNDQRKTILVLGGSQGSKRINDAIKKIIEIPEIARHIQIIHQYGFDSRDWKTIYYNAGVPAVAFDFAKDIHNYYPLADTVICRSGAGSLFETAYFKKRCITIPLTHHAGGHQVANAKAFPGLGNGVSVSRLVSHKTVRSRLRRLGPAGRGFAG